jgi:hypothetical protein
MGIPEYEAKRYQGLVKGGGILLSVHSDNSNETKRAKEILERTGAQDISSTGRLMAIKTAAPKSAALLSRVRQNPRFQPSPVVLKTNLLACPTGSVVLCRNLQILDLFAVHRKISRQNRWNRRRASDEVIPNQAHDHGMAGKA